MIYTKEKFEIEQRHQLALEDMKLFDLNLDRKELENKKIHVKTLLNYISLIDSNLENGATTSMFATRFSKQMLNIILSLYEKAGWKITIETLYGNHTLKFS